MTTVDADAVVAASHLFDYDARSQWTERFLAQPDHHLGIANVDGAPAGRPPRVLCVGSAPASDDRERVHGSH